MVARLMVGRSTRSAMSLDILISKVETRFGVLMVSIASRQVEYSKIAESSN